jgi:hypothetical protein
MINVSAWQNCKTALLLRRISTGSDEARPCAAMDSVLLFDLRWRRRSCQLQSADKFRHTIDRFPNKRSMHLGNRPTAPKSP